MWHYAFSLFLLMDPVGNIPFYLSFLKQIPQKRQRWIILREMLIALFVIFLFALAGKSVMEFLDISQSSVHLAGGIVLFLLALKMIFPENKDQEKFQVQGEPFIVPLAIPLVAGPSILSAVLIFASSSTSFLYFFFAILIAWVCSLCILLLSPWLKKILKSRGITAVERLMGLILVLISVEMFLKGLRSFLASCS